MQEHHFALPLLDPHRGIGQPRQLGGERGEFMIMRRKQRPAAVGLVQMLDRRPRDRQAVECRGAAADLVENDQRALAGLIENDGRFDHLDHERGTAARQVVGRADPREQPVHNADPRTRGGHETADLRHQRDQRVLAQEGRFAGHVGAGDQPKLSGGVRWSRREIAGIGNERRSVALQRLLDHGMPAAFDGKTQ